jgi:hypothetical protein
MFVKNKTTMKTSTISKIVFTFFLCAPAYLKAQSMNQNDKEDLLCLSVLNAQFIKNFINSDTLAHNEIIHKDFVCIQGSGEIVGRNEYMKGWATGYKDSGYATFGHTEEFIRIFGNTALIRSRTPYTKLVNGSIVKGSSVYTDTYVKENGRWWCVQAQITPVK